MNTDNSIDFEDSEASLTNGETSTKHIHHWEDRFIDALFSVGGLALSNLLVMMSMLYFSYSANPPNPEDVNDCMDNITHLPDSCKSALPGLKDYQTNSTSLRVAVIVCVGSPIAAYLVLTLLKPLGVTLRANGLTSLRGFISTSMGLLVIILFTMRGVYCFSNKFSTSGNVWLCAKSEDPSYRILNNTLIQLSLVVLCIMVLKLSICIISVDSLWQCCEDYSKSVRTVRERWNIGRIQYLITTTFSRIDPPPYESVGEK